METSVLGAILGSVASTVVGGLIGGKKSPNVPQPTVAPTVAMPDPMAQKAQARRKAAMFDAKRMGAADTVLAGGEEKLGA